MKKIFWTFVALLFFISITHWTTCDGQQPCPDWEEFDSHCNCVSIWDEGWNQWWWYWWNGSNWTAEANGVTTNTPSWNNQSTESSTTECNTENCDWICQKYWEWDEEEYICIRNDYWDLWIYITTWCLLNGQCKMNIYETIGIRKSNPNPDVKTFAQDIILWATMFFGTVMTILFIVSWLSYVMAWFNGKSPDKAKKMMVWSIVWLLFVTFSYTIIRLIQFFATWWS